MNTTKQIWVTGAGRGIGRTIALKLSDAGYVVAGCARSKTDLAETRNLSGNKIRTSVVDVRDEQAVAAWIERELKESGATPWGLVTAAGIHGDISPFLESNWEEWKASVDVNLYGTALACKSFARALVARKLPGRIALLSGGGATKPIENMSSYCASKAAVVRFGETLAVELKSKGITVNAVAPGAVNTALTETIIAAGPQKAGQALYDSTVKQKNSGGTPPDKAGDLVRYLMSEESAPVTGRLIAAVWDDWVTLHKQNKIIDSKDFYTLRRLVPEEQK